MLTPYSSVIGGAGIMTPERVCPRDHAGTRLAGTQAGRGHSIYALVDVAGAGHRAVVADVAERAVDQPRRHGETRRRAPADCRETHAAVHRGWRSGRHAARCDAS